MKAHWCAITQLLILSDIGFALTSPFVAFRLRNLFESDGGADDTYLVFALSSAVAAFASLYIAGCCKASWRFYSAGDALRAVRAVVLGTTIGVFAFFPHDRLLCVTRTILFIQMMFQLTSFVGVRLASRSLFGAGRKRDGSAKQVLIVGCNGMSLTYMHAIRELSNGAVSVAGFLTEDRSLVGQTIHGRPVLETITSVSDAVATLQVHGIDVSTLVLAPEAKGFTRTEIHALDTARDQFGLAIEDVPFAVSALLVARTACEPKFMSELALWKPGYALLKRTIDVAGSALLLLAAAPLMLLACAIVAADVGLPVLFWQQRLGKDGKRLMIYKFRTMRAPLNTAGQRIPDVKRVSDVGRWLRKLRVDELPQLISVLRGDMSFVGPRPLLPVDQPLDSSRRLAVKPGLTGWAQVHGGNLVAREDKNALDLWYVAHSSLGLDIQIGLRTILMLLRGDSLNNGKIRQAKIWMDIPQFASGT